MTKTYLFLILLIGNYCLAQQPMYKEIPPAADNYKPGNIISRMVDGLGYRYYWATEGLRTEDLSYKPSADARDTKETLEHILGLSETILNASTNTANIRPKNWASLSYKELREQTLSNLKKASELYQNKTEEQMAELHVIFESDGNQRSFPFWNMINGPIADAIYHTGQLVTFRRAAGNPTNPKVNVFMGKNRE